jgi:hypothetical protein
MKMCSIASIKNDERTKLKKLEINAVENLNLMTGKNKGFEVSKEYNTARGNASMKIEELDETLMDILQGHGFLMGVKADSAKLAGVS